MSRNRKYDELAIQNLGMRLQAIGKIGKWKPQGGNNLGTIGEEQGDPRGWSRVNVEWLERLVGPDPVGPCRPSSGDWTVS